MGLGKDDSLEDAIRELADNARSGNPEK